MKAIEEIEEELQYEDDETDLPPSDIVAFNELRSCADLFRMYDSKSLDITPEFQREIVWSDSSQTRFIDSLIKQLPIPSMCFSYDYKREKWQVVDGLQRISSIIRFLSDDDWKLSKLDDIDPEISGRSIKELKEKSSPLHKYYNRVQNLTLPITVLRCDYTKKSHQRYLFKIFHRLNTGGAKLNNQEIRNCIFSGPFNELLKQLDKELAWRSIHRMKSGSSYRFLKQELILRFFAFGEKMSEYKGRLATFLNDYMDEKKNIKKSEIESKAELFRQTLAIVYEEIFSKKPPEKINNTLLEALFIGVSTNLEFCKTQEKSQLKKRFSQLKKSDVFSDKNLREGLSHTDKVQKRFEKAIAVFS